jgi:hypothetical protein
MKRLGGAAYYQGVELKLTDPNKNGTLCKSKAGESWDRWPEPLSHLKIRQKPLIQVRGSRAARQEFEVALRHGERVCHRERSTRYHLQHRVCRLTAELELLCARDHRRRDP